MRLYLVVFTISRKSVRVAFTSRASTLILGRMTSDTRMSCKSNTPSTIFASSFSIPPDCLAPITISRSSSSDTFPLLSLFTPNVRKMLLITNFMQSAKGEKNTASTEMTGTVDLATISALDTPSAFGSNSPKNKVKNVRPAVAWPNVTCGSWATTAVKSTVLTTCETVVSTSTVVSTRVMSSFKYAKGLDGPSSSANSRTFQGYSVVIEISAACSEELKAKRDSHKQAGTQRGPEYTFGAAAGAAAAAAAARAARGNKRPRPPKSPTVESAKRRAATEKRRRWAVTVTAELASLALLCTLGVSPQSRGASNGDAVAPNKSLERSCCLRRLVELLVRPATSRASRTSGA
mmetsp:Transcript_62003/g.124325  ORF Transcript_62003/g.124325 Transcript_62003/m.124325 type:complete len:348 (+) Transcript_62003:977-2020(+)